jgi:sugar phosphate isomerase/epimerase
VLSLAAGTVLDAGPIEVVESAAAAGFDACGLRLDPGTTTPDMVGAIGRALAATGIRLLDVEVIRMRPGQPAAAYRPVLELAAQLGAPWVLTVTEIPDPAERIDRLADLADLAAVIGGIGISLEFMAFTAVRKLSDAVAVVTAVPRCRILVDALHLARTGGTAAEVAGHTDRLSYIQLCDAALAAPSGLEGLALEARHGRLLPGTGELDLPGLVTAVPADIPFSVEVQSDRLAAELTVRQRAEAAFRTGTAVLAER